jgi:uncharacterized protein
MQFIIIARDYKDALERRLAVREKHVALGDELHAQGHFPYGVALLDDNEKMKGSVLIMDFSSRKELDEYLKNEPYVVNKVWESIEILPCRVGPTFTK